MANLENLKNFDRELKLAVQDVIALNNLRSTQPGVFSAQQDEQISKLQGVVNHLSSAVSELVNANR